MAQLFSWIDYSLFVLMLALSAAIGIYYGFFKVQATASDYLLGGKRMSMWPIALSLISSSVSGVPLLTFPTEIYYYGITYSLVTPILCLLSAVTYFVYMPVFYKIQVTSTYEYFKLRFDNKLRILASILYTIYMALYLPLIIYVPALALSQVTGIHYHVLTPIICGVCIFYTTLGGFKAVVWTDALQFIVMIGSLLVIVIVGIISVGGLEYIWKTAGDHGRLTVDFTPDVTVRDTFWTGVVANFFLWMTVVSANQSTVQKCLSLSSFKDIRNAFIVFGIGVTILNFFINFSGMAMFAKYFDCDPVASGQIKKRDQLLPFYIMDVAQHLPGLPGLFVSGILSAALSTLSAAMNCLAATIYEDFLTPFMSKESSDKKVRIILKSLVLGIGIICTVLVYVVEHLGNLLPLAVAFLSLAGGPLLGLFSVGMLVPMVNSKGALWGGISSLLVLIWMIIGTKFHRTEFPYSSLPVSTDNCTHLNITLLLTTNVINDSEDEGFLLYRISHFYYSLIGVLVVFVVSIVVSCFTRDKDYVVNRDCISPVVHFLLPKEKYPKEYHAVEQPLMIRKTDSQYKDILNN